MEDKKQQIIIAAQGLFNRLGYAKTSVDDIASTLGMKKSSLYYYFKNKEDIFMCSFKSDWEVQFKESERIANKESNPLDRIISYITQSLDYHKMVVIQHKIPVKVLIETRNMYRDFVSKTHHGGAVFFDNCLKEGIEKGIIKSCDTSKIADAILLVKFSIQYDQFNVFINVYPKEEDLVKIKEEILFVLGLLLDGLKK